jgi:hypothetical protein
MIADRFAKSGKLPYAEDTSSVERCTSWDLFSVRAYTFFSLSLNLQIHAFGTW